MNLQVGLGKVSGVSVLGSQWDLGFRVWGLGFGFRASRILGGAGHRGAY